MRFPLSILVIVPASLAACDAAVRALLWGAVLRLAGSWLLAVLLAPKALMKWMRP